MPLKKSPQTKRLIAAGHQYYLPVYKPRHTILDHGRGAYVTDMDGNQYVDLSSGIGVNMLGYGHPELVKALKHQSSRLWHTSNIYFTAPVIQLAREWFEQRPSLKGYFFTIQVDRPTRRPLKSTLTARRHFRIWEYQ